MNDVLALIPFLIVVLLVVFVVRQKKAAKKEGISTVDRIKKVVKEL
jgi:preprotein translocase subunit YajC